MTKKEKITITKIRKKLGKTLEMYNMVSEGETIIIGLSGGKDSLALLDLLYFKKKQLQINFSLIAVHVRSDSIPYESDIEYLNVFCKQRDIKLIVSNIEIDFSTDNRKTPCFLCSWNRRKALFEAAQKNNANKVALGHHMNDSVETLLMNMIFNGNFSAIPASLSMFNNSMKLIRPMIELTENEINEYSRIMNFTTQTKVCPHGDKTQRNKIKELITHITEINPHGLQNINSSMSRVLEEYLVKKPKKE